MKNKLSDIKGVEYNIFSEFMQKLLTDKNSLQNPDNAVRKVYEGFKSGIKQRWLLIDANEYLKCMEQYSHFAPQSDVYDELWTPLIKDWVAKTKENILQFAANSYLCSGPTLEQDSENSQGQNLHALLWFNLTGDEEIPYRPRECGHDSPAERRFFDTYWRPFTKYIETKYGDGAETFETDSQLNGLFNIVAEFEKNCSNNKLLLAALDNLINLRHNRGTLAHLFIEKKT